MSKKRIQLKIEGGPSDQQLIPVAWYVGTPLPNIIELIKQAFGFGGMGHIDANGIGLYDSDGDLVVLSDSIPNDQIFTVKFLGGPSGNSIIGTPAQNHYGNQPVMNQAYPQPQYTQQAYYNPQQVIPLQAPQQDYRRGGSGSPNSGGSWDGSDNSSHQIPCNPDYNMAPSAMMQRQMPQPQMYQQQMRQLSPQSSQMHSHYQQNYYHQRQPESSPRSQYMSQGSVRSHGSQEQQYAQQFVNQLQNYGPQNQMGYQSQMKQYSPKSHRSGGSQHQHLPQQQYHPSQHNIYINQQQTVPMQQNRMHQFYDQTHQTQRQQNWERQSMTSHSSGGHSQTQHPQDRHYQNSVPVMSETPRQGRFSPRTQTNQSPTTTQSMPPPQYTNYSYQNMPPPQTVRMNPTSQRISPQRSEYHNSQQTPQPMHNQQHFDQQMNQCSPYNNLQAMGQQLRGMNTQAPHYSGMGMNQQILPQIGKHLSPGASSTSSCQSGVQSSMAHQQINNHLLIASKRNTLRELAAEELDLPRNRVSKGPQSPSGISSHESTENHLMNSRTGTIGQHASPHLKPPQQFNQDLLNTPLANAMKKAGMTPVLDNRLNNFVKKKVINNNQSSMQFSNNSNSTSPKPLSSYGDGTGGHTNDNHFMPLNRQSPMGVISTPQTRQNQENHSSSGGGFYMQPGVQRPNYGCMPGNNESDEIIYNQQDNTYANPPPQNILNLSPRSYYSKNHFSDESMSQARTSPRTQMQYDQSYQPSQTPQTHYMQQQQQYQQQLMMTPGGMHPMSIISNENSQHFVNMNNQTSRSI